MKVEQQNKCAKKEEELRRADADVALEFYKKHVGIWKNKNFLLVTKILRVKLTNISCLIYVFSIYIFNVQLSIKYDTCVAVNDSNLYVHMPQSK